MDHRMMILGLAASVALTACAQFGSGPNENRVTTRYELKDGTRLIVDPDGRMRMFDAWGRPVYMKDGEPMVLKDGSVIVMKENTVWKALRLRGTFNPRT